VQALKPDDLGAQAIAKELGNLPIVVEPSLPAGTVRVVLGADYTGPGSGLGNEDPSTIGLDTGDTVDPAAVDTEGAPLISPILTAGSDDPACVN
jgi:hypothetical protein